MLESLRAALPYRPPQDAGVAGKADSQLALMMESLDLQAVAAEAPARGGAARLREIAGWGAALGDMSTDPQSPRRTSILRESALFNVGVAVFDSCVDDRSPQLADLCTALEPGHLRARLIQPCSPETRLTCTAASNEPIVRLFDDILSSIGLRLMGSKERIEELAAMLGRMYRSELALRPDPFEAKCLPVVFIGALGEPPDDELRTALFLRLARFLQVLDDWQDLADDLWAGEPNAFLGPWRPDMARDRAAGLARGGWLVLMGPAGHERIARELRRRLEDVLDVAEKLDAGRKRRLAHFLRALLG